MSIFEPGKEYKTRDGRRARVYAVDVNDDNGIHGAMLDMDGQWRLTVWTQNGLRWDGEENDSDLMPPKRGWWVNVYLNRFNSPEFTWSYERTKADANASSERIACVYIEEGDGL